MCPLTLNEVKRSESRSVVFDALRPRGLYSPWNSPGQNTGVGSCCLLQGIFPNQRSNPGLLHCRQILYQLSHQGSPRILEWAAYPFSRGSSQPRNQVNSLPPQLPENPIIDAVARLGEDQHPAESSGSLMSPRLIILWDASQPQEVP